MATFLVRISMDNAVFDESPDIELVRLLKRVVEVLEHDSSPDLNMQLRDLNGNRVGFAGLGD